ncbi:hypothetical protein [Dokdonia sp. R86516]|uniref:hypothetical protein n=1 Tax=Dokdonia sp. R86516 TaxID=3093856 RepID=UPI0037C60103
MNKKSRIVNAYWPIIGITGIIISLTFFNFTSKWYLVIIGGTLSVLLAFLLEYIMNKLFYIKPIETKATVITRKRPKLNPIKPTNHEDFQPNTKQNITTKKETVTDLREIISSYEVEVKTTEQLKQEIAKKEVLPTSVKEIPQAVSNIKRVNYNLIETESETDFPILKIPNQNSIVRKHRNGSTKRRGFKETSFQKSIEHFFSENFEISGNTRLNTGENTRPYEPDIAIIGYSDYNIRIDIEIDEPYAGITRQPTHCTGDDVNRDNYFKNRGWIVIRFSEYQIHTQEKECLKYIAEIISSIDSSIQIPSELKTVNKIIVEKVWDVVQSQKWEKLKYREEYLNHEFQRIEEEKEILERGFDPQEIEEEKFVKSTSFGKEEISRKISFNHHNTHNRDQRIKFFSDKHIYTIDGVTFPSASTIVGRFFQEFDSWGIASRLSPNNPLFGLDIEEIVRIWNQKGQDAANLGTFLHEQIENFYLKQTYERTEEFYQFENFVNDHPNLEPHRSEWRIFDDNFGVAGTIDLIVKNEQNFDIYDWKRSKKIINVFDGQPIKNNRWGKCGVGKLSHIPDTTYNKYCLQQSLYRFILEENYNINVNNMYLIIVHPEYTNYYKVKVPYLRDEVKKILNTV